MAILDKASLVMQLMVIVEQEELVRIARLWPITSASVPTAAKHMHVLHNTESLGFIQNDE